MDTGFFKRRIREAIERRRRDFDLSTESARLVFAEADFLPGLIVDRYVGTPADNTDKTGGPLGSWLSVQFLSWGMDARKEEILTALEEVLATTKKTGRVGADIAETEVEFLGKPEGIIERDDAAVRELEGLPLRSGLIAGTYPEKGIIIRENGLLFAVDLLGGQKTGHFLDQKFNRALAARFASGRRVLDACCHTGGFAINAAHAGAVSVTALDSSAHALSAVSQNADLNGVGPLVQCVKDDIFDYLRSADRAKEHFDLIVLDPPAFAKSRVNLDDALRGYREINSRALRLLDRGGILVSCSCSHALGENRFKSMINHAAMDAEKRLRLVSFTYQSPDHPILLGYDESLYLKCGIYEVL
jgi:23S rRNA (cytosine1962-C5)-methyltransferase